MVSRNCKRERVAKVGEGARDDVETSAAPQARELLAGVDDAQYLVISRYISLYLLYLAISLISHHIRAGFCEVCRPGEGWGWRGWLICNRNYLIRRNHISNPPAELGMAGDGRGW